MLRRIQRKKGRLQDDPAELEVRFINQFKGRGVFAAKEIKKGDYICEYEGVLHKDSLQTQDDTYIYEFMYSGKRMCIDASKEDNSFGRLINDDHLIPNCKSKIVCDSGCPRIFFYSLKDISAGSEITYNYGPGGSYVYPWRKKIWNKLCNIGFISEESHLTTQNSIELNETSTLEAHTVLEDQNLINAETKNGDKPLDLSSIQLTCEESLEPKNQLEILSTVNAEATPECQETLETHTVLEDQNLINAETKNGDNSLDLSSIQLTCEESLEPKSQLEILSTVNAEATPEYTIQIENFEVIPFPNCNDKRKCPTYLKSERNSTDKYDESDLSNSEDSWKPPTEESSSSSEDSENEDHFIRVSSFNNVKKKSRINTESKLTKPSTNAPGAEEPDSTSPTEENESSPAEVLDSTSPAEPTSSSTREFEQDKGIYVRLSANTHGQRKWNKTQFCLYCNRSFTNLTKHLFRVHSEEREVAEAMAFPLGASQRAMLLEKN